MSEAKHTAGEWEYRANRYPNGKLAARPYIYAAGAPDGHRVLAEMDGWEEDSEIQAMMDANGKRIVACVNGCDGINPAAVKDLLEALSRIHETSRCFAEQCLTKGTGTALCSHCQAGLALARAKGRG